MKIRQDSCRCRLAERTGCISRFHRTHRTADREYRFSWRFRGTFNNEADNESIIYAHDRAGNKYIVTNGKIETDANGNITNDDMVLVRNADNGQVVRTSIRANELTIDSRTPKEEWRNTFRTEVQELWSKKLVEEGVAKDPDAEAEQTTEQPTEVQPQTEQPKEETKAEPKQPEAEQPKQGEIKTEETAEQPQTEAVENERNGNEEPTEGISSEPQAEESYADRLMADATQSYKEAEQNIYDTFGKQADRAMEVLRSSKTEEEAEKELVHWYSLHKEEKSKAIRDYFDAIDGYNDTKALIERARSGQSLLDESNSSRLLADAEQAYRAAEQKIYEVFGKQGDRAMEVLKSSKTDREAESKLVRWNDLNGLEKSLAIIDYFGAIKRYDIAKVYLEMARSKQPQPVEKRVEPTEEAPKQPQPAEQPTTEAGQPKPDNAPEAEVKKSENLVNSAEDVPDVVNDKPADARARGFRMVNGVRVDRQPKFSADDPNIVWGREVSVKFSNGITKKGRIAIVDISRVQPSHINGQRNPKFFNDEAQPKNRTDVVSQMSKDKIAKDINPSEITGEGSAYQFSAPTTDGRGEIIQGNNRGDALRTMYSNDAYKASQDKYKEYLTGSHAEDYGLDADRIEGMQKPAEIIVLDVPDEEAIKLGQYSAKDIESGGIERIDAIKTTRLLGENINNFANILLSSPDEDLSLSELIVLNGKKTIGWLNKNGIISDTQAQSALSNGTLTAEAKMDLRNILEGSLYEGGVSDLPAMFHSMPVKAQKAILSTFMRDFKSEEGARILPEIQKAIELMYEIKTSEPEFGHASSYQKAKAVMRLYAGQYRQDNEGNSYLPAENISNFAKELACRLQGCTMRNVQQMFNDFFDLVQGTASPGLFNETKMGEKLSLHDAIERVFNIDYKPIDYGRERSKTVADNSSESQAGRQGESGDAGGGERIPSGEQPADSGTGIESDGSGIRTRTVDEPKPFHIDDKKEYAEAMHAIVNNGFEDKFGSGYAFTDKKVYFYDVNSKGEEIITRVEDIDNYPIQEYGNKENDFKADNRRLRQSRGGVPIRNDDSRNSKEIPTEGTRNRTVGEELDTRNNAAEILSTGRGSGRNNASRIAQVHEAAEAHAYNVAK